VKFGEIILYKIAIEKKDGLYGYVPATGYFFDFLKRYRKVNCIYL
jgi:hypothetical protein